jgi:hypothetical protein
VELDISSNRAGVGSASNDANCLPHPSSDQRQYCTIPASFPLIQPDLPFPYVKQMLGTPTLSRADFSLCTFRL